MKLIKRYTDYDVTVRIVKAADGRYAITSDTDADSEDFFAYESGIHPDHKDDLEYMASGHCEDMACMLGDAAEEFGF